MHGPTNIKFGNRYKEWSVSRTDRFIPEKRARSTHWTEGWVRLTVNKVPWFCCLHLLKPPTHIVMAVWLNSFSFAFQYQLQEEEWAKVTELCDYKTNIHAPCFSFWNYCWIITQWFSLFNSGPQTFFYKDKLTFTQVTIVSVGQLYTRLQKDSLSNRNTNGHAMKAHGGSAA